MTIDGQALDAKTEALTSLLTAAETQFLMAGLRVEVSVSVSDGLYLAFAKRGQQGQGQHWGLYVLRPGLGHHCRLVQASRADRIASTPKLGELRDLLLKTAAKLSTDLTSAIVSAHRFVTPVDVDGATETPHE